METSPFPRRSKIAKAGVCEASLSSFQPQFGGGGWGGEGVISCGGGGWRCVEGRAWIGREERGKA